MTPRMNARNARKVYIGGLQRKLNLKRWFFLLTEINELIEFLIQEYQYALSLFLFGTIARLLSLLFILPITLSYFHYRRVKIKDYLIIVGFLIGWMINLLIAPLNSPSLIDEEPYIGLLVSSIVVLSAAMNIFFGTFHAMRLRWEKPPTLIFYGNLIFLLIILVYVWYDPPRHTLPVPIPVFTVFLFAPSIVPAFSCNQ